MKQSAVSLGILLLLTGVRAHADIDPPTKDMRIALRYGFGEVLIVGGSCSGDGTSLHTPAYRVALMPARRLADTTPEFIASQIHPLPKPATAWKIGDRWQLYPGSGPPVSVVIEKVLLLEFAKHYHDGAVARIDNTDAANRIAGLRASEYLSAPGNVVPGVSQTPLLPEYQAGFLPTEDSGRVNPVLLRAARKIVHDKDWQTDRVDTDYIKNMIREMNTGLLTDSMDSEFPKEIRILRWPLPGKPLLFIQACWSRDDGPPLFAVDAIVERSSLKILSFDTDPAESMRTDAALRPNCTAGSFKCPPVIYSTMLDLTSRFLNAWKIGDRYFVLTYAHDLLGSGFSVVLQELNFETGLRPTSLAYRVREN